MSLKSRIFVDKCPLDAIKGLMETHHYSKSVFGVTVTQCFAVYLGGNLVGGAIFGLPAGTGVYEKYSENGKYDLLELRRFVMIDDTPRNTESCALGKMFKELALMGVKRILSYADPNFGHSGVIYRATGFEYLGKTAKRRHFMWKGKKYPDRNYHQTNFPFHAELRAAVDSGEATRVVVPGKHIYLKKLS